MDDKPILGIYCRVSTGTQEKKLSLPKQRADGISYAEANGFIPMVFSEAKSGKDLVDRKEWQKLEKHLLDGTIKALWVANLDRLNRHTGRGSELKTLLLKNGVTLIEGYVTYDLTNDNDSVLYDLKNVFADYERRRIVARTKAIRKDVRDQGRTALSAIYGYDKHSADNKKVFYTINEFEANHIRRIFDMVNRGIPLRRICIQMLDEGFRGKNGGVLHHSNLSKIIRYPYYCGKVRNSEGRLIESALFKDIPLVDVETWDSVQQVLLRRGQSDVRIQNLKQATYPLSGILTCGECGQKYFFNYSLSKGRKIESYRHLIQDKAAKACQNKPKYLMRRFADQLVKQIMVDQINDFESLEQWFNQNQYQWQTDIRLIEKQIETLTEQNKAEDEKIQRLVDLALAGTLRPEDIKKKRDELQAAIDANNGQITVLEREMSRHKLSREALKELAHADSDKLYSLDGSENRTYYLERIKKLELTRHCLTLDTIYGYRYTITFPENYFLQIRKERSKLLAEGYEQERADSVAVHLVAMIDHHREFVGL